MEGIYYLLCFLDFSSKNPRLATVLKGRLIWPVTTWLSISSLLFGIVLYFQKHHYWFKIYSKQQDNKVPILNILPILEYKTKLWLTEINAIKILKWSYSSCLVFRALCGISPHCCSKLRARKILIPLLALSGKSQSLNLMFLLNTWFLNEHGVSL